MPRILLLSLCFFYSIFGHADWAGQVVGVHDGDTATVMRNGVGVKVRLDEIDAPELGQAYGRQAKLSLSGLCYGRTAAVREQGRDKYGRTLCRLICGGTDANAEQVRRGYAWFYVKYGRDSALRELEAAARARRAGLWTDRKPTPPWEFRHSEAGGGYGAPPHSGGNQGSASSGAATCECGGKRHCSEMSSCEEALFYLYRCGLKALDRNHDGMPCESLCR